MARTMVEDAHRVKSLPLADAPRSGENARPANGLRLNARRRIRHREFESVAGVKFSSGCGG